MYVKETAKLYGRKLRFDTLEPLLKNVGLNVIFLPLSFLSFNFFLRNRMSLRFFHERYIKNILLKSNIFLQLAACVDSITSKLSTFALLPGSFFEAVLNVRRNACVSM